MSRARPCFVFADMLPTVLLATALLATVSGCGGGEVSMDPDLAASGGDAGTGGGCGNITGTRAEQVCLRWNCDRVDLSEGDFNDDVSACKPGTTSATSIKNVVKMVNLYRFLADLPSVTNLATRDAKAQACSLIMEANGMLSHYPPMDWTCWNTDGNEAAGKSNISTNSGVPAVDAYMTDSGTNNTMELGHRRWILNNHLGPVGVGSTAGGSCLWVQNGSGKGNKTWMSYPPPGPVPMGLWQTQVGDNLDETGWTVQSDTIDIHLATVTITRDGKDALDVDVTPLLPGYGSEQAIKIVPRGWKTAAGHTYHVALGGVMTPIEYDVQVLACDAP